MDLPGVSASTHPRAAPRAAPGAPQPRPRRHTCGAQLRASPRRWRHGHDGDAADWRPCRRRVAVAASSDGPSPSSLKETAAVDELIDLLLRARSTEELGKLVAENLLSFDQRLWLRLATRSDSASSPEERQKLQDLAGQVMRLVEALVRESDSQLSGSAQVLQRILVAAADEDGQWHVPLPPEKLEAMRQEMEANAAALDESLLANAFAWMRKANEDKLDGTVAMLQQLLQLYAARALVGSGGSESDDAALDTVLAAGEAGWLEALQGAAGEGGVSQASFLAALRRRMETVVLALPSGSYAQRVQAEYLKELETRAEGFFKSASS